MTTHAHRTVNADGTATCECGQRFATDDAWRHDHYEQLHDEEERAQLEGRKPPDDEPADV